MPTDDSMDRIRELVGEEKLKELFTAFQPASELGVADIGDYANSGPATAEPTAQDFVSALMSVFTFVLPVIETHCAEFIRTVERLADTVDRLNDAEYRIRTGRKHGPATQRKDQQR